MSYSLVIKWSFAKLFQRNIVYIIISVPLVMLLLSKYSYNNNNMLSYISERRSEIFKVTSLKDHYLIIKKYSEMKKNWRMSNLGTILFKHENISFSKKDKTFVIFVENWPRVQFRHVFSFGKRRAKDFYSGCSVDNCFFTGKNSRLDTADAVLVNLNYGFVPDVNKRNPKQIWVFHTDEPPSNVPFYTNFPSITSLANNFNWSMTYRTHSDVPVPYGRTVPLIKPFKNNLTYEAIAELIPNFKFKRSDVLVAIMISRCGVPKLRLKFVAELQKHMKVDVYGNCSVENKDKCPGHFANDCVLLDQYYFYLVMENSMCPQYISEKSFFNAYTKGAIPIIVGPLLQDCKTLLPPKSYIYYNDYQSVKQLAEKISSVFHNIKEYLSYHLWRNHFKVLNEHGFFGTKSFHLCRLCEALNYNEVTQKTFSAKDLKFFLDPRKLCISYEHSADVV